MALSYYVWAGVGAIEDLDGDDHPAVDNRLDAIALFSLLSVQRRTDLSLWERDGDTAKLIAAKFGYDVALVIDQSRNVTNVIRKGS